MMFQIALIIFVVIGIIFTSSTSIAFAQNSENFLVNVEVVVDNLKIPWSIVFTSDDRIFFTEREGKLRVIENGELNPESILTLDVGSGEGGLLGITLDPKFEENHYLYLYYTYSDFLSTYNKVVRFTEFENVFYDETILIDKIPGAGIHDGGRIKFGPDGKLYITTGEAGVPSLAQDLNSLGGKILRINSDGSIPDDNPFENSSIYSYGHRNPQGLDWDPVTGKLVISEHGPSGERGWAHDEVNVIEPGKNYGWPEVIGDESDPKFVSPIIHTGDDTWAPSGASFYTSDNIPSWNGKYFVATLRGEHLRMLDLDLENNKVLASESFFFGTFGRLRDAVMGPDGNLYLLTSNRDARTFPGLNDDKIIRVIPFTETGDIIISDSSLSPRAQSELGIEPQNVLCKEELTLIFKDSDGNPACVKPTSVQRLMDIGWASPLTADK